MRALTTVGLALLTGAAGLEAQHAREYEFSMFGSYTKYDASSTLAKMIGGGVRLGYAFGDRVGLEADVLFQPEYTLGTSNSTIEPLIGGVSLVVNLLHGAGNSLYVLGGYSLLDFGATAPYQFTDGGIHGGVGDRIFLTRHLALRLEARAIYTPDTKSSFTTNSVTHLVGSAGLAIFAPGSKRAAAPPAPPPAATPPPVAAAPPTPALPTPPLIAQDADQDGVPDKEDACPNTPLGAKVDVRGCPLDTDQDGVPDGIDQCPDTPVGTPVDATGCAMDADHDGVPDGIDKCPDTPAGATVDATGCPSDSDHDGVLDGIDKCPNTPPGTPVDAVGCPVAQDADGDGVPDTLDKCPNTPPGVPVDATGCMILFRPESAAAPPRPGVPPRRPTLVLRGVNFQTGRSVLTTDSYAVLDQVAASLLANPEIKIEVAGYTDNTGPVGVNIRLSQARAAAVRAYLARKGVSPTRILARGYGSRSPIAPNTTTAGRAQNRRVELHKLP